MTASRSSSVAVEQRGRAQRLAQPVHEWLPHVGADHEQARQTLADPEQRGQHALELRMITQQGRQPEVAPQGQVAKPHQRPIGIG